MGLQLLGIPVLLLSAGFSCGFGLLWWSLIHDIRDDHGKIWVEDVAFAMIWSVLIFGMVFVGLMGMLGGVGLMVGAIK